MDRREKQRKFHQAIIDMLYLPPTPRPHTEQVDDGATRIVSDFDLNRINDPENFATPSSSSDGNDEDGDLGPNKLTRAQRKRLRKKKLNQISSISPQRRKIIGPLLPLALSKQKGEDDSSGEYRTQAFQPNASENKSQNTIPTVNKPRGCNGTLEETRLQGIRQNAAENQSENAAPDSEECNAPKEGKLKRRRVAKKLAREKTKPSPHQDECDKDGDSAKE